MIPLSIATPCIEMPLQIERREIRATLDTTGTVTFQEDEAAHTTEDVNKLLRDAQMQSLTLSEVDREIGRSKEFLTKVCDHATFLISGI